MFYINLNDLIDNYKSKYEVKYLTFKSSFNKSRKYNDIIIKQKFRNIFSKYLGNVNLAKLLKEWKNMLYMKLSDLIVNFRKKYIVFHLPFKSSLNKSKSGLLEYYDSCHSINPHFRNIFSKYLGNINLS